MMKNKIKKIHDDKSRIGEINKLSIRVLRVRDFLTKIPSPVHTN